MAFGLFESEFTAGFHLEFFQVLNWGLFNGRIYTLNAESKSTLLTGVNGSGKTTLVDALTTLLVPAVLRFYNQSSGSTKKRDRSEESYVLGAYGNIQNTDYPSNSNTRYLRNKEDVISILNGCFYDKAMQKHLSLLQVRYFSGSELQRVFAITEKKLSVEDITDILKNEGINIDRGGKWKRILSNRCETFFYDSFERYKVAFSPILGFRSDKALKLFSQIVGLKVLGNLTEFIRENMLEKFDTDIEFQKLEHNYENLLQSERTILKTQKQIELLEPIIQIGKKLAEVTNEREKLTLLRDSVNAWKIKYGIDLLLKKKEELDAEIATQTENQKNKKSASAVLEESIRSLQADIDNTESARRISQIESEVRNLEDERERRKQLAQKYEEKVGILEIEIPNSQKAFEENFIELQSVSDKINQQRKICDNSKTEFVIEQRNNDEELEKIKIELTSLGMRNSNIPEKNIRIRSEICTAVKCVESELPFAGELLQVKTGEKNWNYAIEKLLHNFALTILVPEEYYKKVTDYVKSHDMGGRVVYLRAKEKDAFTLGDATFSGMLDSDFVPGKIDVRQGHPLSVWIQKYIEEKFDYRCTDDIMEISRAENVLTSSGLIKSGIKHEKDDRKKNGQIEFVLGWDNTQKRKQLSNQLDELSEQREKLKAKIEKSDTDLRSITDKQFALASLLEISSWNKIDYLSVAKKIDNLNDERKKLAASKDIKQMQKLLDQKREEKHLVDCDYDKITMLLGNLDNQHSTTLKQLSQNQTAWEAYSNHSEFEKILSGIEALCEEYPRLTKVDVDNIEDSATKMTKELSGKAEMSQRTINGFITNIQTAMSEIKNPNAKLREQYGDWANEFSDMGTTKEYLADYTNFFERLKKDDLPKYRKQFHEYLHNSVKDDIINFNQYIENAKDDIQNAVQYLNQNLKLITYQKNPNTYLLLKCEKAKDVRIDEFNRKLHNSIPDVARIAMQDTEYEEQLFNHIKGFLESLKENQNVRDYVLDIRNWFTFAASENYTQDNVQKQYYSDSASLSGGEKAKLTYTILASAISYQFGISEDSQKSFRFVIIDEAFSKSDSTNSEYAMKLFKQLNLQVMVITPLDKINIVEDYISSVHMAENKNTNDSRLISMTINEYRENKEKIKSGSGGE